MRLPVWQNSTGAGRRRELLFCAGLFQQALRWQGVDLDMDEVECITANLIYKKYVKGYISHKNQVSARAGVRKLRLHALPHSNPVCAPGGCCQHHVTC